MKRNKWKGEFFKLPKLEPVAALPGYWEFRRVDRGYSGKNVRCIFCREGALNEEQAFELASKHTSKSKPSYFYYGPSQDGNKYPHSGTPDHPGAPTTRAEAIINRARMVVLAWMGDDLTGGEALRAELCQLRGELDAYDASEEA